MTYFNLKRAALSVFLAFLIGSCRQSTPANKGATLSIAGAWKIVKVVRNLDDITAGSDFGQPMITLDADGTYTVDKTTMFVVNKNGHWSVRTQSGGYIIVLKPREDDSAATYEMRYDTSGGGKNMTVNFTTGGYNTYQYLLERVTPQEKGKLMKLRRRPAGFAALLLLSVLFSGCISIYDVIQPLIANAGETITIMVNVKIPQTKTNEANRIIFGFLVPRDWNVAKNAKITYSSDRGDGKMTPVPPGVMATGFNREWPSTLISRFGIGANLVKDMEWVIFQTDSTYASTMGGPAVKGVIKIITKVGIENEIVKPGYFVTTGDGIDPSNNPFYGKDLHIVGGRGQLFDFSHSQVATIVPVRSVDNDYITMTFDGNARKTPLMASTAVYLQAIAYTGDQQFIKVTEKNARTRLAPMGDNKWSIQIWPRSFFNLQDGQSLSWMEYYFTDKEGTKVNYDQSGTPFIYEFSGH